MRRQGEVGCPDCRERVADAIRRGRKPHAVRCESCGADEAEVYRAEVGE